MESATPWAPRRGWGLLGVAGLVVAAALFWFDPAAHRFYPQCIFHRATGLLCPGCGGLRACHQLLHGHFGAAFHLNPLLILAAPLAGLFAAPRFGFAWTRSETFPSIRTIVVWLLLGAMAAVAIWRNLPGSPFSLAS